MLTASRWHSFDQCFNACIDSLIKWCRDRCLKLQIRCLWTFPCLKVLVQLSPWTIWWNITESFRGAVKFATAFARVQWRLQYRRIRFVTLAHAHRHFHQVLNAVIHIFGRFAVSFSTLWWTFYHIPDGILLLSLLSPSPAFRFALRLLNQLHVRLGFVFRVCIILLFF